MPESADRAELLFNQGRHDLAEAELRRALAETPDDSYLLTLLALTLVNLSRPTDALDAAQQAAALAPDVAMSHYALAQAHIAGDRNKQARAAIDEALRLDPEEPGYFYVRGALDFDDQQWARALEFADRGLALDPEHPGCVNLRSLALTQLGRKDEAAATIRGALARDPDNPATHANQGLALLHQNRPREAAEHFREALRLDPQNEFARSGMLEALRARNPIYRLLLIYFMWMSRLSSGARWGVIVGGYFVFRVSREISENNSALLPWVVPLWVLYLLFVLLSWTGTALSNLLLRLDPFARYVLSRDEIRGSNAVGLALLGAVVLGLVALVSTSSTAALLAALSALLVIPLAATFEARPGRGRWLLTVVTALIAGLGLAGIVGAAAGGGDGALMVALPALLLAAATPWIANALALRQKA